MIIGIQLNTESGWKNSDFFRLITREVTNSEIGRAFTDQELDQLETLPCYTIDSFYSDVIFSNGSNFSEKIVTLEDPDFGMFTLDPIKKIVHFRFDQEPLPIPNYSGPYLLRNPLTKISDAINYIKKLAREGRIAPRHIPKKFDLVCFNN